MFGVSGQELFLIALVALVLLGPQRIPDLARALARGYREFTRVRRQVDSTIGELRSDLKLDIDEIDVSLPAGRRVPLDQLHTTEGAGPSPRPDPLAVPAEDDYLGLEREGPSARPAAGPAPGGAQGLPPSDSAGTGSG